MRPCKTPGCLSTAKLGGRCYGCLRMLASRDGRPATKCRSYGCSERATYGEWCDRCAVIVGELDKADADTAASSAAQQRKQRPVYSGVLRYFPKAMAEIAHCSFVGNEQHNPGTPLRWDRSKSFDEHDALARHLLEAGTIDSDGVRHSTKVAWRALAALEKELEALEVKRP